MMNMNKQNRSCQASLREASVGPSRETLRCPFATLKGDMAQGDNLFPILLVKLHHCAR
jgi:hypothetical protein